jgi:glycosyltransferase involved in cell wall biosynthesis
VKTRVLLVGRQRYRLPLNPSLRRKFDALQEELDVHVLASAAADSSRVDGPFSLVPPFPVRRLDGVAFWLSLPVRIARALRLLQPDVLLVQGAHEAAAAIVGRTLARRAVPVVLDVHGDWRSATRLYGSSARRLLSPLADRVANFALRRAEAVRTVSDFTSGVVRAAGREPTATFFPFMDLEPFLSRPPAPLPEQPSALFVGVLERYKDIDGLAAAWRLAARRVPESSLRIVGRGSRAHVVERLVAELPARTAWIPELTTEQVAAALDAATCLVLPSPNEGLGRVIVEALCRGRPVVGTNAGGIRDLVRDGVNGLLVDPGDPGGLADALVRVLGDRALAERLASAARPSIEPLTETPEEYAERVRALLNAARAA